MDVQKKKLKWFGHVESMDNGKNQNLSLKHAERKTWKRKTKTGKIEVIEGKEGGENFPIKETPPLRQNSIKKNSDA